MIDGNRIRNWNILIPNPVRIWNVDFVKQLIHDLEWEWINPILMWISIQFRISLGLPTLLTVTRDLKLQIYRCTHPFFIFSSSIIQKYHNLRYCPYLLKRSPRFQTYTQWFYGPINKSVDRISCNPLHMSALSVLFRYQATFCQINVYVNLRKPLKIIWFPCQSHELEFWPSSSASVTCNDPILGWNFTTRLLLSFRYPVTVTTGKRALITVFR